MPSARILRALFSVSDKRGAVEFARELRRLGVEILSTGGTARALREGGVEIVEIDAFTGFPEMLDGRVKTLHPKVHAGILHRRDDPAHLSTMEEHGLEPIDLVVVNLYPFEQTVARPDVTWEEAVEQIDIGGPTLIRSAAKNHADVTVACRPEQYGPVLEEMRRLGGATSPELRRRLALEAFRRTAEYDRAISGYFSRVIEEPSAAGEAASALPQRLEISLPRRRLMRYGENPHQAAGLYGDYLESFEQLHGKELSYNNLLDLAAATELAARLGRRGAAVAIIKHSNPCGAAASASVAEAWRDALATDPQSASGGIVAASQPIDAPAAEAMGAHFIELCAAPGYAAEALDILRRKKNRILLRSAGTRWLPSPSDLVIRSLPEGLLVQTADAAETSAADLRVVTKRAPSDAEMAALLFGWDVVRSVKSNAIVFATDRRTLGVGAGQMSRVDSARLAVLKARDAGLDLKGSAVASDAFFPFPDGLLVAADAGATAAIQPGGSVRDAEVIAAADERGMAMVFTGRRHFRH
ncbi:MAG: bifunctional phosphoribosylaminoimidazolecarboxamide formyltransferase/IMP cyclohydrolase [Planctomycetes bacterium]|nr:bifunctional phosphoribosylaminoimidazolecarboxamide formyltransferase/IMP cyclohydrolase [Planctomycetota bacterium]